MSNEALNRRTREGCVHKFFVVVASEFSGETISRNKGKSGETRKRIEN